MMKVNECIYCRDFPCTDVNHDVYQVPPVEIATEQVRMLMISEAVPPNKGDYYYAEGDPLFQQTTIMAFRDAGVQVSTLDELIQLGVYFATAVKCGKTGYGISAQTVKTCSELLRDEILLFPNIKVIMLMGDVAIRALNYVAKAMGEKRVIPNGPTYKIRKFQYYFRNIRVFPSYLQAGASFFIEKSKRRMIAEDIAGAIRLIF